MRCHDVLKLVFYASILLTSFAHVSVSIKHRVTPVSALLDQAMLQIAPSCDCMHTVCSMLADLQEWCRGPVVVKGLRQPVLRDLQTAPCS